MISSTLASLIWLASSSSLLLPASLSSALSKSNRTSADNVSFWITGRGGSGWASTTGGGGGGGAALCSYATTATGTLTRAIWSHGSTELARVQKPERTH